MQTLVDEGHLSLGHAKALSGLPLQEQALWATAVVRKGLTVRSLEKQLSRERQGKAGFKPAKPGDWRRLERELADLLATPVQVSANKAGKGELKLAFHSLDELDGLLARLGYRSS